MLEIEKLHNFLLVSIIPQNLSDEDALKDLRELKSLVEAFGGEVKDLVTQSREVHDKGLYIGKGKIAEVAEIVKEKKIDVVVLNAMVKPGHIFDITNALHIANPSIQVWDRVDLRLHLFSEHASTAESRLQIELASMRHMGPRIYGMGYILSRQGGSIGTRGIGETNTELMKRHWRNQIKKVQDKLKKMSGDRERQLEKRRERGLKTISIIGYTNAGKTSLFNLLSGKKNVVQNALFVTLDSSVSKLYMPSTKKEVLLSDTIGFIKNLPTDLIDAFKSTLMESINADILLHVIDATDEDMERKIAAVEEILWDLGITEKKQVYVFNKSDLPMYKSQEFILQNYKDFTPQFISVKERKGIESLLGFIEKELQTESIVVPASHA